MGASAAVRRPSAGGEGEYGAEQNPLLHPGPPLLPGLTPLSDSDVECLSTRQLFVRPEHLRRQAISCGRRCEYGWPQAVLSDPLRGTKMADMTWLTCPLLAMEIEKYEAEGAVRQYNESCFENEDMQKQLREMHFAHRDLRRRLVAGRDSELDQVRERLGSEAVDLIMGRGLDFDPNSNRLRCLHAHVADYLVRGTNQIGKQVLADLEARGVRTTGCAGCAEHCGMAAPLQSVAWKFKSHKTRMRKSIRRQIGKEKDVSTPVPTA